MPQLCDINPYIRRARYDVIQTPWNLTERIIYDYELLYIKEGNFHITIEDQTFDAQTGELYLFHPGQRHAIQVLEEGYVIQPHLHFDLFLYPDREQVGISFLNRSDMNEEQLAQKSPEFQRKLRYYRDNLVRSREILKNSKIRLGYGTDLVVGYQNYECGREYSAWLRNGMDPFRTLKAATAVNAEILGLSDVLGTIEPGKLADFIITNSDYSEKRVFIGGKEIES